MERHDYRTRTKQFALRIIRLVDALHSDRVSRTLGAQLLRSGTSVAANYRSAQRARSAAEFAAKMGIVEEEADESVFWMELLVESGRLPPRRLAALQQEGSELVAIAVASIRTTRRKAKQP